MRSFASRLGASRSDNESQDSNKWPLSCMLDLQMPKHLCKESNNLAMEIHMLEGIC